MDSHFFKIDEASAQDSILDKAAATATVTTTNNKQGEDIMSVLLAHEKKGGTNSNALNSLPQESSDSSDNEELVEMQPVHNGKISKFFEFSTSLAQITKILSTNVSDEVEVMDSDEDDSVPTVTVGNKTVAITDVNDALIAEMTPTEKETYIQTYQEYYSMMYD